MKKAFVVAMVMALSGFLSFNSYAKELKIGVTDIFKVFDEYDKTKEFDKVLEAQKNSEEAKLESKRKVMQDAEAKLALLKPEEQESERANLAKMELDLREAARKAVAAMQKQRDDKMQEIVKDINDAVADYAKQKAFDLIINKNALVYGADSLDVTADVIGAVNQSYRAKNTSKTK